MKSVLKLIMNLRERNKHIKITVMIDKIIAVWVIIPCLLRITVQILTTDLDTIKTAIDEENKFYKTWLTEKSTHPLRLICDLGILIVIMLSIECVMRMTLHKYAYFQISSLILDVILISLAMMMYVLLFRSKEM